MCSAQSDLHKFVLQRWILHAVVCSSPTNSTVSPLGMYFERCSIIMLVSGLTQTVMLPEVPSNKTVSIHVHCAFRIMTNLCTCQKPTEEESISVTFHTPLVEIQKYHDHQGK